MKAYQTDLVCEECGCGLAIKGASEFENGTRGMKGAYLTCIVKDCKFEGIKFNIPVVDLREYVEGYIPTLTTTTKCCYECGKSIVHDTTEYRFKYPDGNWRVCGNCFIMLNRNRKKKNENNEGTVQPV